MCFRFRFLICVLFSLINAAAIPGLVQERRVSVAVLEFGDSEIGRLASRTLAANLESIPELLILDRDQASAAAKGAGHNPSLNMTLEEARGLGAAIGSDFYVVGDAQTLRRSPSDGPPYFESYASVFVVSSRTGRLLIWQRPSFRAAAALAAEELLLAELATPAARSRIHVAILQAQRDERVRREIAVESSAPLIETAPDDDKSAAGLRLPRPFRRLSPPYPETAASAEVEATVDVLVDLDINGEVGKIEIARWAGFGLDEATIQTVRQLHFFPAMRNGTPIPLRVLLRYNFRKPAR